MTWIDLEAAAHADHLALRREFDGVSVMTTDALVVPLVKIFPGDLSPADADVVVRAACAAALCALKELPR